MTAKETDTGPGKYWGKDLALPKIHLLESDDHERYLYYNEKNEMLIPLKQDGVTMAVEYSYKIPVRDILLAGNKCRCQLVKNHEAVQVFRELKRYGLEKWDIESKLWHIDKGYASDMVFGNADIVYNGKTGKVEKLPYKKKANYLQVIYLSNIEGKRENNSGLGFLRMLGFKRADEMNMDGTNKNNQIKKKPVNREKEKNESYIQELLDCDKRRCGLASYEKEMLYDIKAGHWDIFENPEKYSKYDKIVPKDPRNDIRKNGVIGIDFGTKSTVVVKQEGSNEIRPIRIGSLSLSATVLESDYENPTIISCMDIDKFLTAYQEREGRPETSCEDLFVSYHAYEDYKNCPTENFYAFFSELKQWANKEKQGILIQDVNKKNVYQLAENQSMEEKTLNPIELYAYYIGMYINNMRNGIFLKYVMSFPVKYAKDTKEFIRKSFEKGIKKSLPNSVVADTELMKSFSVKYEISEPAAYAVTALEQSGYTPQDETEQYLYGIFDFGGGTTDFDFGVWRGASEEEYDKYNCDYILECFGADSDVHLGGENILDMLAYHVYKKNKDMAEKKRIACALPVGEVAFIGGENLINHSQSANRNLKILKESLRPLWEQHDNWQECYHTGKGKAELQGETGEYIDLQMYDFNGKAVPNCKFSMDTNELLGLVKERIWKGVEAFFNCIEKTICNNISAQRASEKMYIFLAGNSSKSVFVKEIFNEMINKRNSEYGENRKKVQDRFELIEPLKGGEMDQAYIPNAKTSVAYGLVKSRPGGKIYIKKNYETDAGEETHFQYYLGTERKGKFNCKLTPTIKNERGESQTSYHIWHQFQGAGMGVARIYYTDNPLSDSKTNPVNIDKIPFHEICFEKDENRYLFVRAVKPSVIEYTTAENAESITDDVVELEIGYNE